MKQSKETKQFTQHLVAYLTDDESNYVKCFATMSAIEGMLNSNPEYLLRLIPSNLRKAKNSLVKRMRCTPVEALTLWLSTKLAKDKQLYFKLGLLKTKRKGQMVQAELLPELREHYFAMMKFRSGRQRDFVLELIRKEEFPGIDGKLHARVARMSKQTPLDTEYLLPSKLQRFLLDNWIITPKDRLERNVPPLCFCSDPTIVKLVNMCHVQPNVTAKYIRKAWERLGLRKARRLLFFNAYLKDVLRAGRLVRTLMMTDLRHRN